MILDTSSSKWPLAWSLVRTAHYTIQHRAIPLLEYALTGKKRAVPPNQTQFLKHAYKKLYELLRKDSLNIQRGLYPASVLIPENPLAHFKRTLRILLDGMAVARRRKKGKHNDFSPSSSEITEDFPDYYVRNFHFQTDGYFSAHSAEIYDHQVEILFTGAADAMRRIIIPLLKDKIPGDGKGLRFLEIGAGTGRLTKFMKMAYPKAQITVLEPSEAYMKKTQNHLEEYLGVNYIQGFGENLPFKDETFDVVYSCFLFHEVPMLVRKKILGESYRVLKADGHMGFVDSLQLGDDEVLDWSLQQFPKDFHEPFYMDYIKHPMEELLHKSGFTAPASESRGFFSKALLAGKS